MRTRFDKNRAERYWNFAALRHRRCDDVVITKLIFDNFSVYAIFKEAHSKI